MEMVICFSGPTLMMGYYEKHRIMEEEQIIEASYSLKQQSENVLFAQNQININVIIVYIDE